MIKKRSLIAIASVLTLLANSVNAEIINSVTESTDGVPEGSKKIIIEGTIPVSDNNDYVGKSVTLEVLKAGIDENDIDPYGNGDEFEYTYQTQADNDGSYRFEYTKNSQTGNYLIRIGYNTKTDADVTKKIHEYISPQDYIDFDNSLNSVYEQLGTDGYDAVLAISAVIDEYTEKGVLNIEKYNELKASEDADTIAFVCNYLLSEDKPESVLELTDRFDEGYVICLMNDANADKVSEVLSDEFCVEKLGLDEAVMVAFGNNTDEHKAEVFKKLADKTTERKSVEEIRKDIYNAIILEEFDTVMYQTNLDVIKAYNSVLNVSLEDFEDLEDEKKENAALVALAEKLADINDIDEVADAFDEAVAIGKKYKEKTESSSDDRKNNSSGGGRGGMSIIHAFVPTEPTNSNESTTENVEEDDKETQTVITPSFNDIDKVLWANEAIEALAKEGIISGDGTGKFNPSDDVTREEFIKMAILALGLNERSEDIPFTDVMQDKWYYEYVQRAVYYKLINGVSSDKFGVGESIKRADVAVILERLLRMYGKEYSMKDIVYSDVLKEKLAYGGNCSVQI